ncbi:MAG: hypothetical protein ACO3HJ_07575 [Methylophilaceae bacterium]
MALPSLAINKYELTVPSTDEVVEFRPFLVKEEKMLLIAQQSGDEKDIIKAVENIINECTYKKIDAKKLPIFDLEYIFIQLRAKSIGEISTISVTCPDDGETKVEVDINLEEVICEKKEGHTNKIELTDDVGVIMNYPRVNNVSGMNMEDPNTGFEIIKNCIASIYDENEIYDRNDISKKELDDFVNSMSHQQFMKLQEFFENMPRVRYKTKVKNPNTGVTSDLVIEGLQNFF